MVYEFLAGLNGTLIGISTNAPNVADLTILAV